MAEQVSTLLVFDYLQGNDDRWSSFNLRTDEHGRFVYRDNNAGWFVRTMARIEWQEFRLRQTQRIRRSLMAALEGADGDALRTELARDPAPDGPVISDAHVRAYEARRAHVLEYFRGLVARYGDAAVMAWE